MMMSSNINTEYIILKDGDHYNRISKNDTFRDPQAYDISDTDYDILDNMDLISVTRREPNKFTCNFVGSFITPNTKFFSLPKGTELTKENVELVSFILNRYNEIRKNNSTVIKSTSFDASPSGNIQSSKYYYNKLLKTFLDFQTYEFMYPEEKKYIQSKHKMYDGEIDVVETAILQDSKPGYMVYAVNDISRKDWILDDIYYSLLIELIAEHGSDTDKMRFKSTVSVIRNYGYNFGIIDISDANKIVSLIKKHNVSPLHKNIKRTLLDYFNGKLVEKKYPVNILYTKLFQNVWEEMLKTVLKHDKEFNKKLIDTSNPTELHKYSPKGEITTYKNVIPDITSTYNGKKVIFDAKYYKSDDKIFYKEFYEYNNAFGNVYPIIIIMPGNRFQRLYRGVQTVFESFVFTIPIDAAIMDIKNDTDVCINRLQTLINKTTTRRGASGF